MTMRVSAQAWTEPSRRCWRGILFRLLALGIGLVPLVSFELVLWAFDLGRPGVVDDPFVGFSAVRPLFELSRDKTRYEMPPAAEKFFRRTGFPAVKPPGEFRIFCLGGSTVQGRPFSVETSFTTWLELALKAAEPETKWRVINCAGVSYATYREAIIVRELLTYQPDLFIICTGHNEFLEDRTYEDRKQLPKLVRVPLEQAARLRTFGLIGSALSRLQKPAGSSSPQTPMLGPEVEAVLDYEGGLDSYHRNDVWRQGVIDHFRFNLKRIVVMTQSADVPVLLLNPVANLDTPPFKSEHRAGLTPPQLRQFDALWNEARGLYSVGLPRAIEKLRAAIAIDDQHAGIHYALAKCLKDLGRLDDARAEFVKAKELDICPLRILEPMSRAIHDVALETNTPQIDLQADFGGLSPGGITGYDWLVDHVHPSIKGHQRIATLILDELTHLDMVHPRTDWIAERDRLWRENLASLDDFYYLMGQKRLGNLMLWAQGRGNRVRAETHPGATALAPARPVGGDGLGDPDVPTPAEPAATASNRSL